MPQQPQQHQPERADGWNQAADPWRAADSSATQSDGARDHREAGADGPLNDRHVVGDDAANSEAVAGLGTPTDVECTRHCQVADRDTRTAGLQSAFSAMFSSSAEAATVPTRLSVNARSGSCGIPQTLQVHARSRGLPLPALRDPSNSAVYAVITRIDIHGRIADRSPIQTLHWMPRQPVDWVVDIAAGILMAVAGTGSEAITGQGHLLVPARLRRALHLTAADRLLVVAVPQGNLLAVHTMSAVQTMLRDYHLHTNWRTAT